MSIFSIFDEYGIKRNVVDSEFPPMPEMKMVCLIGSMRFYDIMLHEATEIHKLGHLALIPFKDNEDIIPKERLESYDNLIRKMIMISDIVYVMRIYRRKCTK